MVFPTITPQLTGSGYRRSVPAPTDTRTRIVAAAARRLGELGPDAVTTRGVAEDAGVQAPTIYRLFGDKDGLLEAVAEHVLDAWVDAKTAAVAAAEADGADPVEDLRASWDAQMEFSLAHPAVFRLLHDSGRASPAALRGQQVLAQRVHRVAASGRLRVPEERAVALVHGAGVGAVHLLLAAPPSERDLSLADDLRDAVLARILIDAPAPDRADGDRVAVVNAFRAVVPGLDALTEAERALLGQWVERVVT